MPTLEIAGLETVGLNGYPIVGNLGTTGEAKAALSTLVRTHSLKYGWNERRYWFSSTAPAFSSGRFGYANTFMRAADNTTTAGALGLSWAAFMMALPTTVQLDTNDSGYFSNRPGRPSLPAAGSTPSRSNTGPPATCAISGWMTT